MRSVKLILGVAVIALSSVTLGDLEAMRAIADSAPNAMERRVECTKSRRLPSRTELQKIRKHPFLKYFRKKLREDVHLPECANGSAEVEKAEKNNWQEPQPQPSQRSALSDCPEIGKQLPPRNGLRKNRGKLIRVKHFPSAAEKNISNSESSTHQNCSAQLYVMKTPQDPQPATQNSVKIPKCRKIKFKEKRKFPGHFLKRRRKLAPLLKNLEKPSIFPQKPTLPPLFSEYEEEGCAENESEERAVTPVTKTTSLYSTVEAESSPAVPTTTEDANTDDSIERIRDLGRSAGKFRSSSHTSALTTEEYTTTEAATRVENATAFSSSTTEVASSDEKNIGMRGRGLNAGKVNQTENGITSTSTSYTTDSSSNAFLLNSSASQSTTPQEFTTTDSENFQKETKLSSTEPWLSSTKTVLSSTTAELFSEIGGRGLSAGKVSKSKDEESTVSSPAYAYTASEESAPESQLVDKEKNSLVVPVVVPGNVPEMRTIAVVKTSEEAQKILPPIKPELVSNNELGAAETGPMSLSSFLYSQIKRRNRYKNRRKETEFLFGPVYKDYSRKVV